MNHPKDPASADAVLATLRERYRASLGATLQALDQLGAQLAETPTAADVIEATRREVHRIHGSAGSYGFSDVSQLAKVFEQRLSQWSAGGATDAAERATLVRRFTSAVRREVLGTPVDEAGPGRLLLLVGLDPARADGIGAEAVFRGLQTRCVDHEGLRAALVHELQPRAIIVPARHASELPAGLSVPVVVLTDAGSAASMHARPAASGTVVVDADEPPTTLLDVVTGLASQSDHRGATLVVVDDDPTILALVRAIGEHEGLRVVTLESADHLPQVIDAERPAMLLMDINLGDVDGISTTRILRSSSAYRDLPIVLFSSDNSAAVRALAFGAGADDFFSKPLVPQEVQRRLQERLERRRWRRVVDGMHPVLEATLAVRTATDGPTMWERPEVATMALLRPAPGMAQVAWVIEAGRALAAARRSVAYAGFVDGDALVLLSAEPADALSGRLRSIRAQTEPGTEGWHAGVVAAEQGTVGWEDALGRAREALDVARRSLESPVHCWSAADQDVPPDVIIVEDDAALADMLQYALNIAGYTYQHFVDGSQALTALLAMRTGPDRPVVLLDVNLPGLDGHTLHDRLRVDRPGAFVVVFVSAHASEGGQLRALNGGAWDYLTKPLSMRVLLAKLPTWITRAAAAP
jgi:DNA-binding response OmpR family regulator/HPt (histidine-containing phosphotransfer) domain-containing protein